MVLYCLISVYTGIFLLFTMLETFRLTGRDEVVPISLNSDFTLSPPQRNHQLIFDATNIILRALGDDLPLQDRVYNVACAFANGGNTSDLISQMNVTVQLQAGMIPVTLTE